MEPDWPSGMKGLVPIEEMRGDDEEDMALLTKLKQLATNYVLSFPWCVSILDIYFGDGVGGIVAVFLFHIVPARPRVDEWLWVVVGDLPSAYFVTDDLKSPYEVLEAYIEHRERWIRHAAVGEPAPHDVMSTGVPSSPYWASELSGRMKFLREQVLPYFRNE